jgi:hypothetical protein
MSTQNNNGYLPIFRSTDWYNGLSAEQMQQVADKRMAWFNGLEDEGKCVAGNPLEREGNIVGINRVVLDGPFAKSKESIGGHFLFTVGSLDEAVTIAQQCPGLSFAIRVEVRPIAGECPMAMEARAEAQLAHA